MAKYRATEIVFIPGLREPGAEFEFRGWPRMAGLEPIDDDAKAITEYWKANAGYRDALDFQLSPFDAKGRLHLPPLGPPCWRLGESYAKAEKAGSVDDGILARAIGHNVMGAYRNSRGAFACNRWPEKDVLPANEQAELIAQYVADHPNGPFADTPWDERLHCVNLPRVEVAA